MANLIITDENDIPVLGQGHPLPFDEIKSTPAESARAFKALYHPKKPMGKYVEDLREYLRPSTSEPWHE
jgi:hypothetical protein